MASLMKIEPEKNQYLLRKTKKIWNIYYLNISEFRLDEKRKHPNLNPIWNIYLGLNSWQQPSSERG